MDLQAATDDFEARVRESFGKQGMMTHMGAEVVAVRPGFCELELPRGDQVLQQHGLFHGGAIAAMADVAGGYAAFSLFEPDDGILTVEFKVNCIAAARGDKLVARGEVVRPGRTLTVTRGKVIAVDGEKRTVCALMQQTLMRIVDRQDIKG